jgi:hypothetical protein
MMDIFELPVDYNGKELVFPAELLPMGFTHKIKVTVEGVDILFEPDEERNYRAMAIDTERVNMEKLDKNLLQVICLTLDQLFGS